MAAEKRRSDRLMLTVPLVIHGTDPRGATFKDDGRTITLNRHGARIQTGRPLRTGQVVRLVNQISHREADFRVVGPVAPFTEKGGEYGVECLQDQDNVWGIQFPPPAEGSHPDSKALMECRKCRTVAVLPLSLVEVEVLETAGILSKPCQTCDTPSAAWGYAEKQVAMQAPPGEAAMLERAQTQVKAPGGGIDQRRHRRVSL
jgi:hypothetical protein